MNNNDLKEVMLCDKCGVEVPADSLYVFFEEDEDGEAELYHYSCYNLMISELESNDE